MSPAVLRHRGLSWLAETDWSTFHSNAFHKMYPSLRVLNLLPGTKFTFFSALGVEQRYSASSLQARLGPWHHFLQGSRHSAGEEQWHQSFTAKSSNLLEMPGPEHWIGRLIPVGLDKGHSWVPRTQSMWGRERVVPGPRAWSGPQMAPHH